MLGHLALLVNIAVYLTQARVGAKGGGVGESRGLLGYANFGSSVLAVSKQAPRAVRSHFVGGFNVISTLT